MCGQTTPFIYDGDGNLVKKIKPDNSKTIYVGRIYEVDKTSGGSVTQTRTYYPAGGAMRIDGTLYYILKDHLGSASVISNASGVTVSGGEQRYYPYGESRLTATMLTDKLFTGQREMAGLGIYHYQARFYSPKLGRFLSPDTIVPSYTNSQSLNRFSYVLNNPLRYNDPTGHMQQVDDGGSCDLVCFAKARDLTPGKILKLNKNKRSDDVEQAINDYMSAHPKYEPGEDWGPDSNGYGAFYAIRHDYWRDRCLGGGCDAIYDPDKLYSYYDLHERVLDTKFDLRRIDWNNTALDAVGIPLAIFGANTSRFGKSGTTVLNTAGGVGDTVSLYDASRRNDTVGQWLSFGGALPGIGAQISAISLIYDIGQGFYKVEWTPSIPR